MEWKQPEALRRHWVLGERDGELTLYGRTNAVATARLGRRQLHLQSGGGLRRSMSLLEDGRTVATCEWDLMGTGAVIRVGEQGFLWKMATWLGTMWELQDAQGRPLLVFRRTTSLEAGTAIERTAAGMALPEADELMILCWYAMLESGRSAAPGTSKPAVDRVAMA